MAFSSAAFVCVFLPLVFLAHTLVQKQRVRNAILVATSLVFYSAGALIHLPLLMATALVNYLAGLLFQNPRYRTRPMLALVVALNLTALLLFKYLGFFGTTVNQLCGTTFAVPQLALPIGISFFTFQGMSYVIDVYRRPETGSRSFGTVLLYLSFFPQLVAGPIVKYWDVAEQIAAREPEVQQMAHGARRFIVGLSKKLLLADLLAVFVDGVFADGAALDWRLATLAAVGYSLQIYFDFSGYSDMAIGMGKLFGFRFLENFDHPYLASSIRGFWKRWHISLTSWFREYLYIPLGGNRRGKVRTCLNVLLIFLLTGLWHGASWTFVLWGVWHGLWSVLERVTPLGKLQGRIAGRILTMLIVVLGFVLFRADTVGQAFRIIAAMCGRAPTTASSALLASLLQPKVVLAGVCGIVLSADVPGFIRARIGANAAVETAAFAGALLLLPLCILRLAAGSFNPFIYFRF